MTRLLLTSMLAATLSSGLAHAEEPVNQHQAVYAQDKWNFTRDMATIGGVVGGLGFATAAAGMALRDESSVPSGLMIATGGVAAASGAGVMGAVGLQQRYEFLNRSNSPVGSYLSLGLVGLSGISLVGAAVTPPDGEVHATLLYGGAAIGATAMVPAALQLASNSAHRHASVAWMPQVSTDRVGAVVMARW